MRDLQGKLAVVTGAAHGIGAAVAACLGAQGMRLCLVDLREDALESTAKELAAADLEVHAFDVSDRQAWRKLAAHLEAEHGGVDLLVNNAGLTVHGAFADQSFEDLDRIVDVNVKGVLYGCRVFLPQLRRRNEAHIVNVSSLAGRVAFPYQTTYCATKYAVRGLGAALRMEVAGDGVGVTTVMPGAVATELLARATSYDDEASGVLSGLMLKHGVSPTRVAARVLRAIRRNEAEVLIGWDARMLTAVASVSRRLVYRGLASAFRKRRRSIAPERLAP